LLKKVRELSRQNGDNAPTISSVAMLAKARKEA